MDPSPRAALTRVLVLLMLVVLVSFAWESWRNVGMHPATGEVVKVRQVVGSRGGDGEEFTIRYQAGGEDRYLITRRGILDSLGSLRNLGRGDSVPVEVNSAPPYRAEIDTLTGRYGVTLCFAVLAALVLVIWTRMPRHGARK